MPFHLPTLTRKTRKLYDDTVMPSLRRVVRTKTLDTDYAHPAQLGAKIAELLCRRTVEGLVVTEAELCILYVLHKGTAKSREQEIRNYIKDITKALDGNPNTSLTVIGNPKTGWSIQ